MFPAGAGMNRWDARRPAYAHHVPRRRGDEPLDEMTADIEARCSPQARG